MRRKQLTPEQNKTDFDMPDPRGFGAEACMNPWNGQCSSTDIALYIMFKGRRLPICWKCWEAISSTDIEWMYD